MIHLQQNALVIDAAEHSNDVPEEVPTKQE